MRILCLWHRISTAVSGLQLCDVAPDALLDPFQTPFHLGLSEVLVPRIDGFELRSVDGNARCTEQTELAAQCDELAADLSNGLAVVLAEIRDGLEIRRQLPGKPDHLDVALALALQASARRHPIEVAIDVGLERRGGVVAGSAGGVWLDSGEAEFVQIKSVHEYVDRTHRIVLGYVVVQQRREQRALTAIHPFHEPRHGRLLRFTGES